MPSSDGFSQFVSVVVQVDAPGLEQPFTYGVPTDMRLAVGDAVMAPFGSSPALGHVVAVHVACPPSLLARIKPVTARIENAAAFDEELLSLSQWVAEDTFTDVRDTMRLIAPEIMEARIRTRLRLAANWDDLLRKSRSTGKVVIAQTLSALGGIATQSLLAKAVATGTYDRTAAPPEPIAIGGLWDLPGADSALDPITSVDNVLVPGGQVPVGPAHGIAGKEFTSAMADLRRRGIIVAEYEITPPKARPKIVRILSLTADVNAAAEEARRIERRAPRQAAVLRALIEASEGASPGLPSAGLAIAPGAHEAARALAEKGLATYIEAPVYRNPFRIFGDVKDAPPPLTDAQSLAARTIGARLAAGKSATILLHGVTGSGKTEVYLDAVARALALERSALILVPEIGLTAQLLDLFKARFGDEQVAVLHSALSAGERHDEWQRIKTGAAKVVLGARSAAFAPLCGLGLIIMDEEHDSSYKQDNAPRYHARDIAIRRAASTKSVVLLGSATPSLESYYRAQAGDYELLHLAERIDSRPLPPVHIVDLREEFGKGSRGKLPQPPPEAGRDASMVAGYAGKGATPTGEFLDLTPTLSLGKERWQESLPAEGHLAAGFIPVETSEPTPARTSPTLPKPEGEEFSEPALAPSLKERETQNGPAPPPARSIFSAALSAAIRARLDRREQTILFLNRRGFATFLLCRDCGHTPACPNCDVSLTFHHATKSLQCHHCDWQRRAPDTCAKCGSLRVRPFGLGTEKVEDSVRKDFPDARLLRMDRDTMARKGAHAEALRSFRRGDADILIGTQIVAKGLDFPNVTLVGVVSADTALNVPDFRSAERAFQLLTQVAGRAGRGRTPGEVIIQTFNPDHESIQRAVKHDYIGFFADEIEHRRELDYPPFSHMANLIVGDTDERHAQVRIEYMASVIRESIATLDASVRLLGPAACPLARLKNRYRWHMVLRGANRSDLHAILKHAFRTLSSGDRGCLSVDIDPLTML